MQALVDIPTDYRPGYELAHAIAPEIASNYVAHTLIGDPLADEMMADLSKLRPVHQNRLLQAAMDDEDEEALRDAPASLRRFLNSLQLSRIGSTFRSSPRLFVCSTGTQG